MTSLEELLTRPEFETVELDADIDEAHHLVNETMHGLTTSETEEGKKYRTTDGMLVSIVGPGSVERGEDTIKLVYRTAPASDLATRKASKILAALEPYAIDR